MNYRLDIDVIVHPGCTLIATDSTDYDIYGDDMLNHVFVEYLTYMDSTIIFDNSLKVQEILHFGDWKRNEFVYNCKLPKDGIFTYYKYIISKLEHCYNETTNLYEIKDSVFYTDGKFYLGVADVTNVLDAVDNSTLINDLYKLNDLVENNIPFYFNKIAVTICNLQKCLVNLQKEIIDITLSNKCSNSLNELKTKRNFILDSVFVLEYLSASQKYTEVQRIIDSLTSCNYICRQERYSINADCNCGNSL